MTTVEAYRYGAKRAWAKGRKSLDVEETRILSEYGYAAWAAFVDGWLDALETR